MKKIFFRNDPHPRPIKIFKVGSEITGNNLRCTHTNTFYPPVLAIASIV